MPDTLDLVRGRAGKKARTRQELASGARRLTLQHGLDAVTIQQIVDAADVSMRTFFNYFSCKEEAVVGVDHAVVAELAESVLARPARETPFEALIQALIEHSAAPERTEAWIERTELVARHPALLPSHLAAMAEVEEALVVSVAERMGTDPASDPAPTVVVASVVAVLRATFAWWMGSDRSRPLQEVLEEGFATLAGGIR